MNFILRRKTIKWQKSATFQECFQFLVFLKKVTLDSRNTVFSLISVVHQVRAAL